MSLTMVDFKHHRRKPPVTFHLKANKGNPQLCAVSAMWEYRALRGDYDGPLFMFQDQSPIFQALFQSKIENIT